MEISEFQNLIRELYYEKDRRRGKERTLMWLFEEMGELSKAVRENNIKSIKEEIADVIAWVFSLANLYNIDVEEALINKYPNKCSKCKSKPCRCSE